MADVNYQAFIDIVGEKYALTNAQDKAPYLEERRGNFQSSSPLILKPSNTQEVSKILKLASELNQPVTPIGGNTGLVGGAVAGQNPDRSELLISLERMNKIRSISPNAKNMVVEAGCILENLQNLADEHDHLFPLSLAAKGTAQIGGNLSTNAGGTGVLAYGNAREMVLGLEVVLPSGEIWDGLRSLKKDNRGYDLKNLFIGAEGTLGIITAACLKLFPKPIAREVAYVGFDSPEPALEFFNLAKGLADTNLTGFELISKCAMQILGDNFPDLKQPFASQFPYVALFEISSTRSNEDANGLMSQILDLGFKQAMIKDGVIAQTLAQQDHFWHLRETIPPAQTKDGGSIKHDIAVPVDTIPDFIKRADEAVYKILPQAKIVNFGHMGDGNLHYNIGQPNHMTQDTFKAHTNDIHEAVYELVHSLNGTFSAEHGIGLIKRNQLKKYKNKIELDLMRTIKQAIDPKQIMNPGKIL